VPSSLQGSREHVETLFLGDVGFVRERRDGVEHAFAFMRDGTAVWGLNRETGQQWWYSPEHSVRAYPSIVRVCADLDSHPFAQTCPGIGGDVGAHRPGHAVLAKIHDLHRTAMSGSGEHPVLPDEIVRWSVGYIGEERVGTALEALGPGWHVLHAVPVGTRGSDVDHVVIGPAGVFTVNTKHHAGGRVDVRGEAVYVGGTYHRYVPSARREAERVREALAVDGGPLVVRPLLCTIGARLVIRDVPDDVVALVDGRLVPWLRAQPAVLSAHDVETLYTRACRADTWLPARAREAAPAWVAELAHGLAAEHLGGVRTTAPRARASARLPHSRAGERSSSAKRSGRVAHSRRRPRQRRDSVPRLVVALLGLITIVVLVQAMH
jgi:hypothetical protein